MDKNLIPDYECSEGRNLLRERRWRRSGLGQILIAMPGAGDATVNNLAFPEWPVLVLADVRDGGYAAIVFEDGDALASARDDTSALLRNAVEIAHGDISIGGRGAFLVASPFHCCGGKVQCRYYSQSHGQDSRQQGTGLGLQGAERHVANEQRVREVYQHVQTFPDRRGQIVQPEVMAGGGHQKQNQKRKEAQALEGKVGQAAVACVADEQAHQRIQISQGVKLKNGKCSMRQREREHGDAEMATVVQERQKPPVEPAQGADT